MGRGRTRLLSHSKWTAGEIKLIYECLADADFMHVHHTYSVGQFPTERATPVSLAEGGEYHRLCLSIAHRIMEEAGDANDNQLRPLQSIASKVQAMREHALGASTKPPQTEKALFSDFEIADYINAEPKSLPRRFSAAGDETMPLGIDYVAPVRDATQITFQTHILNEHLACSLCNGYLNEACTIIECLHTFCKACIKAHFETSQKCPNPKCGKDLGANPTLCVRNDRTLQSIVDKVFPRKLHQPVAAPDDDSLDPAARLDEEAGHAQLSFSLHEEDDSLVKLQLERPFLRTDGLMTIACVRKYVLGKAQHELNADLVLQVLCHEQVLKPEWTLAHAYREYWNNPLRDMALTFRLVKREPKAAAQPDGAALALQAVEGGEDDDAMEVDEPMDDEDE
jgi:hypothetical protein